jgi:rubrerythrin
MAGLGKYRVKFGAALGSAVVEVSADSPDEAVSMSLELCRRVSQDRWNPDEIVFLEGSIPLDPPGTITLGEVEAPADLQDAPKTLVEPAGASMRYDRRYVCSLCGGGVLAGAVMLVRSDPGAIAESTTQHFECLSCGAVADVVSEREKVAVPMDRQFEGYKMGVDPAGGSDKTVYLCGTCSGSLVEPAPSRCPIKTDADGNQYIEIRWEPMSTSLARDIMGGEAEQ